jgi:hypothetical protein
MALRTGRRWFPYLAVAVILIAAMAVIWTAAPDDLRGLILLVGLALTAATDVGLFVFQRSRHW